MKAVFGVRRVHLRGQQAVRNELGILLMSLNLTKLAKLLSQSWPWTGNFSFLQIFFIHLNKKRPEIFVQFWSLLLFGLVFSQPLFGYAELMKFPLIIPR